jgi:hypothetical protein
MPLISLLSQSILGTCHSLSEELFKLPSCKNGKESQKVSKPLKPLSLRDANQTVMPLLENIVEDLDQLNPIMLLTIDID